MTNLETLNCELICRIVGSLGADIQIHIVNGEYVPSVDDRINEVPYDEQTWFSDAWKIVIHPKGKSYPWDAWGHPDLQHLLQRTLLLLQKVRNSDCEDYSYLKNILRERRQL